MGKQQIIWVVTLVGLLSVVGVIAFLLIGRINSNNAAPEKNTLDTSKKTPSVAPTISLTDEWEKDETVSGTLTLKGAIGDGEHVERVEYYVDNEFAAVSYELQFDFTLDTTELSNGRHAILIKAFDKAGKVVATKHLTITVKNLGQASGGEEPSSGASSRIISQSAGGGSSSGVASREGHSSAGNSGGTGSGSGGGGTPADTESPVAPGGVALSADDGYTTAVSWSPSTDNVGVTGYRILRDGVQIGTSATTSYKDQTVVPGNTYAYSIEALDAASNVSAPSADSSITLTTTSIWIDGDTPSSFADDSGSYELGVKFKPLVDGKITGIRYYKAPGGSGTRTGSLWEADGTPLASATFTSETASGWQNVNFGTPVDVTAGTTYVASYYVPDAVYAYTGEYFSQANGGITSQYLKAEGYNGSPYNGVFKSGAGFPATTSASSTNYWVDVRFTPNENAGGPAVKTLDNTRVYDDGYPGTNNTGVPVGKRLPIRDRKIDIWQPNTTVENVEVRTEINIKANNAHIKNVRIAPPSGGVWGIRQESSANGALIEDTEMYGTSTDQMQYGIRDDGSGMTVRRANVSCYGNGIQANLGVTVEDSIVHSPCYFSGDHTDAFISTGGSNITLIHNTFHNNLNQTAAVGFFCDFSAITDATVTNNLLIGGGYPVYAGSTGTGNCTTSGNNKFTNNKFSWAVWPNGGFNGPVSAYTALPGNEWTGNTWYEDGTPVLP